MFISYNDIIYNVNRGIYRYIGEGSSRQVFDLNNGYVIKLAKNNAGIEQNRVESYISINDNSSIFAKVLYYSRDYSYIIMPKARKIDDISYVFDYLGVRNKREFFNLRFIRRLMDKYDLLSGDLVRKSSWGVINGKIYMIDYGFTKREKRNTIRNLEIL